MFIFSAGKESRASLDGVISPSHVTRTNDENPTSFTRGPPRLAPPVNGSVPVLQSTPKLMKREEPKKAPAGKANGKPGKKAKPVKLTKLDIAAPIQSSFQWVRHYLVMWKKCWLHCFLWFHKASLFQNKDWNKFKCFTLIKMKTSQIQLVLPTSRKKGIRDFGRKDHLDAILIIETHIRAEFIDPLIFIMVFTLPLHNSNCFLDKN